MIREMVKGENVERNLYIHNSLTTSLQDDVYHELDDDNVQDFTKVITGSGHIPILANLEELRYDIELNYAADCISICWSFKSFPGSVSTYGHPGKLPIGQ